MDPHLLLVDEWQGAINRHIPPYSVDKEADKIEPVGISELVLDESFDVGFVLGNSGKDADEVGVTHQPWAKIVWINVLSELEGVSNF